jgi:hypothetical protein
MYAVKIRMLKAEKPAKKGILFVELTQAEQSVQFAKQS